MSSRSFEKWLFGKWGPLEKSILSWGKDVVWPEDAFCCACGRISDRDGLCAACRESLEHDGFFFAWERSDPAPDLPVWSLRPHGGVPRELVIRLKYGAEARAARILAGLLLPLPEDVSFPPDTVVTWVTMPESRRRERAVDHGRLLAEAFAEKLSLPCRQLLLRRDPPAGPAGKAPGRTGREGTRRQSGGRFPSKGEDYFSRAHRGRRAYHRHHPLPLRGSPAFRRGGLYCRSNRHRPKMIDI